MSCSCSSEQTHRDRAALCLVCPEGIREGGDVVQCSLNGEPVYNIITNKEPACPLGHHDEEPFWFCCRWIGVPMPVRWWLRLFHKKHPPTTSFAGCGCIKALKELLRKVYKNGK